MRRGRGFCGAFARERAGVRAVAAKPGAAAARWPAGGEDAVHPRHHVPERRSQARRRGGERASTSDSERALRQGAVRRSEDEHRQHARGVGLSARLGAEFGRLDGAVEAAPRRVRARRQGDEGRHRQRGAIRDARAAQAPASSTLAQPLPPADGKDPGDAAKMVERSISEMLKGMPMYRTCIDNLRAQKNRRSRSERAGRHRGVSELGAVAHLPAQRVHEREGAAGFGHRVANADSGVDPSSMLALVNLADAYAAKGDKDKAIETNLKIYRARSEQRGRRAVDRAASSRSRARRTRRCRSSTR